MKKDSINVLSDEQVRELGGDYMQFMVRVETQTAEQREMLRHEITNDVHINDVHRNQLLQDVDSFTLALARVSTDNVEDKPVVQVVYQIEDDLYDYLTENARLPSRLVGFMDGGIEIDIDKPTAIDLMPQTGKTRLS